LRAREQRVGVVRETRASARSPVWIDACAAAAISVVALSALLVTSLDMGMTWDEGYTVGRDRLVADWFARLFSPASQGGGTRAFEKQTLDRYWLFSREEPHGHPPFYALLGAAGWWVGHGVLPPLEAYRLGPMALTALTAGLLYYHLARQAGRLAGVSGATFFLIMPRIFAHEHYAHYDMPMTCLWMLAQIAFFVSVSSRGWSVVFGMLLGLAAGTKITGLFAIVPPLFWTVACEVESRIGHRTDPGGRGECGSAARAGLRSIAVALPVGALVLYAIQPPWWIEPLAGPLRFVTSNLTRAKTQPLATLYFGRVYEFSLPWHNTVVLTAVTTPLLVLLLAVVGTWRCWARRGSERGMVLWLFSFVTLMIVRALPNAPGHDGVRLFLPSIASLAVLAGLGVGWIADRAHRFGANRIALLVAIAAAAECLIGMVRTYPYTDSYYNSVFGGLKGAERHGFELTYYWETTGPEFLSWAREQARRQPVLLCFAMDNTNHRLLREWGILPPDVRTLDLNTPDPGKPDRPDFYVQQRRKGLYYPADLWLEHNGHPVFRVTRESVDLLRVFRFDEFVEAARQTQNQPIPRYLFR
jgi:hypothetical protein